MNQSLWQKLKRVKCTDFLHIFIFLAAALFSVVYKRKHQKLWLFCDLAGEARDNGYWLFHYVRNEHPEEEAVFAIDPTSPDYEKVAKLGKTVAFGSFQHWLCYLSAEHVISSQKASGPNASVCYVLERFRIFRRNKIFLQHGIIKDDISFLYYQYTNIRLFTCSTQRELDYVREKYGYPKENVQLLGLCRFDELLKQKESKKLVLIMPTWRKWLSHPTEGTNAQDLENAFLDSVYYQKWGAFLGNAKFLEILEAHDWTAIFYLHREAQKYSKFFVSPNDRIQIATFPEWDAQDLLKNAGVLVTDYSSVAMDFALLDKPLCYYQFDYQEFRKRHLEEGYFEYETDGFGPVCKTETDVFRYIEDEISGSNAESRKYQLRREKFFTLKDQNNCMRTYEAIQALR